MARSVETEFALSVYRKLQSAFIRDYLNDIPDEQVNEDVAITTKRNIRTAITPQAKDSAVLAVLRMRIFEEYRAAIGDNNLMVLLPDNFQAKIHQFPPQLVVGLGEVINNEVTKAKWTFAIPHYRYKDPTPIPKIPDLHKGNWWGRLVLLDNSRVYINAFSENVAINFINQIVDLIDPEFMPPLPLKIDTGKRGGDPIREVETRPVAASFYKRPVKDEKGKFDPRVSPDWTIGLQ